MPGYADFEFYTSSYLGETIAEADFPRLALRASQFIDHITFNRAGTVTDETILAKIKMATCAVAEEIQRIDKSENGGEIQSETIGRHSVTYVPNSLATRSDEAKYTRVAKLYLWDTGFLYRGL